jgi:hypothetical protein
MLEFLGWTVAGFVSWFLLMLKHGVMRDSPGVVLLISSAIALVYLVLAGLDYGSGRRDFGAVARLLVFYLGMVIAYATWWWRRRAAERARVQADTAADARLRELSARAASPQFELPVYGSAQVLLGVGGLGIAACLFLVGSAEASTLMTAGGTIVLAAVVLLLLHRVPTLGKPTLLVTAAGFRLPHAPLVPWQLVEGIWLEKNWHNYQVISHSLIFYVPTLPEGVGRFPWFTKMLFPLRTRKAKKRLGVMLAGSSEDPEVVYRLSRHLWKQSTGRDYPWFPDMTEEAAAAYRKHDETFARLRQHMQRGPDADPREFKQLVAGLEQNLSAMGEESQRRRNRFHWLAVTVMMIVIVVTFFFVLNDALS